MVFSPPPHAVLFYLGPVIVGYDTLKQEKREINYIGFQNSVEHFITHELKAQYISISLSAPVSRMPVLLPGQDTVLNPGMIMGSLKYQHRFGFT